MACDGCSLQSMGLVQTDLSLLFSVHLSKRAPAPSVEVKKSSNTNIRHDSEIMFFDMFIFTATKCLVALDTLVGAGVGAETGGDLSAPVNEVLGVAVLGVGGHCKR